MRCFCVYHDIEFRLLRYNKNDNNAQQNVYFLFFCHFCCYLCHLKPPHQPMTHKQLKDATEFTGEIKALYQSAFPSEEQIPWDDLMTLVDTMSLDFTIYFCDNHMVGFTIVCPLKRFNWFWYFAVKPQLRGQGMGQKILSQLIDKYRDDDNILDMESPWQEHCPNPEQRRRRHNFYKRNGFHDTQAKRTFEGIEYTIMMRGNSDFTMADYDEILAELKSFWAQMPSHSTD